MQLKKLVFIGAGILVMGSLTWPTANASGGAPGARLAGSPVAPMAATVLANAHSSAPAQTQVMPVMAVAPATADAQGLALIAPPAELPRANSAAMVTSTSPMVPPVTVRAGTTRTASALPKVAKTAKVAKVAPTAKAPGKTLKGALLVEHAAQLRKAEPAAVIAPAPRAVTAMSPANKPGQLFSYARLLNYSPHPQVEEFLKDKPLALNGKYYWFSVRYVESWNVISDDEGYLKGISFEISLMEGEKKVRCLRTPAVAINAALHKGQVLGVVEVAPYKFNIRVDEFTRRQKGVSELVFKLDLIG